MAHFSDANGQLKDLDFPPRDGGFDDDYCLSDIYTHTPTNQSGISSAFRSRHGSVYSMSPPQPSNFAALQQYKADFQPGAGGLTPHFNISPSHRSMDMSREASYASYESSTSSGQQYRVGQQAQSYYNCLSPTGTEMRRTVSMHTSIPIPQIRAYPEQHRTHANHFDTSLASVYPPTFPTVPMHSPHYLALDGSRLTKNDLPTSETDMDFLEFGFGFRNPG